MAPKKDQKRAADTELKAPRRVKAKAKALALDSPVDPNKTANDKRHEEQVAKQSSRKKKQSFEDKLNARVGQCLLDNFKNFTHEEQFVVTRGPEKLTLFARLHKDKLEAASCGAIMHFKMNEYTTT